MPRRIALITMSLLGALTAGAVLLTPSPGSAGSTIVVNETTDAPDADLKDSVCDADLEAAGEQCTLRAAVQQANAQADADIIEVPSGIFELTIPATGRVAEQGGGGPLPDSSGDGDLDILTDMTIIGEDTTTLDAGSIDRVFEIRPSVFTMPITVSISGITVRNGNPDVGLGGKGGGVDVTGPAGSTFSLDGMQIIDNFATYGAGLSIRGGVSATVTNSTISSNTAGENEQGWGAGVNVEDQAVVVIDRTNVSDNHGEEGSGIVNINNDAQVTIMNSTISSNESATYGGGVFGGGSELNRTTIINSTIVANSAEDGGGGIYQAGGVLIIDNTTITGNHADNRSDQGGGGLMQDSDGPITVTNSTIANNTSDARGDGVYLQDEGPVTFRNTIIANNGTANCQKFPGTGILISEGYNLASDNDCGMNSEGDRVGAANLEALSNHGGPTETHSLGAGSEAIDNGDSDNCPDTDQRGFLRPGGSGCDIGAFEAGATEPTPTPEPGDKRTFGDVTCNGPADSVDALGIQRNLAALPVNQTQPCPGIGEVVDIEGASEHLWGDVDCDADVDTVDSLKLLRFVAGLDVAQEKGCPIIGSQVLVQA